MGRRGVQQLTAAQWREALEQQIREKEQQQRRRQCVGGNRNEEEEPPRRSFSAPQQQGEGDGELVPSLPGFERAVTTSTCGGAIDGGHVAGRKRVFQQQQQPREDYLMGLKEQIEEKKRLTQEAQEMEQSRMSKNGDDDSAARPESCGDDERQTERKITEGKGIDASGSVLQDRLENMKAIASSNQSEAESCPTPALKAEIAADSGAITKIADFCEELKKQNEDVKRQLLEQNAVLASLHSTLSVEADQKMAIVGRRNSIRRGSVGTSQTEMRPSDTLIDSRSKRLQSKGFDARPAVEMPVALRPRPTRGETKIPLPRKRVTSLLRSAGTDIVNGFSEKVSTQPKSPRQRAEAKADASVRVDMIPIKIKTLPFESQSKSLLDEGHSKICETKATSSETQDYYIKSQDPQIAVPNDEEEEEKQTTSSAKGIWMKTSSNFVDTTVCSDRHVKQPDSADNESPMDTDSNLIHDWESESSGDELLDCTSISILHGPSSLIPIDRPVSRLF